MKNRKNLDGFKHTIRAVEGLLELAILTLSYYLVWRHVYDTGIFPAYYGYGKYVLAGVYALLILVLFQNFDGFKFGYMKLIDVIISQCIALVLANFITYWQLCLIANEVINPVPLLLLTLIDVAAIVACCFVYTVVYHHLYVPKNMVLIYGNEDAVLLKFKMDTRMDKYRVNKVVSAEAGYDNICKIVTDYDAVILSGLPAELRNDILKFCYQNGIRTYISPKVSDIIMRGASRITLFDTPLLLIRSKGLTLSQRVFKRTVDIVLSLLALVITAPIMLITALAIKLEDGGPVFFKQQRVTINGKAFSILKFRSMIVDAEKPGKIQPAVNGDPRITKVGSVIRSIRVDELPQILNILKGDMSIVGPRPERYENVQKYMETFPEFAFRLKVKGGLTGYAQIYGKYNTTDYDKLRLDMEYIENYSMMLDVKLILTTLRILLSKESTEGFDMREELERKKKELLSQEAADAERND